jgi:hypothetical protein
MMANKTQSEALATTLGIYFGDMEQKNSIDWLIEKFYNNEGMITTKQLEKAKEMYTQEMEQAYQDGKEIGTIETLLKNQKHI